MFEDLISDLQPFARDLVDACGRVGLQPRVTSTRRSFAEQKRLYQRFLQGLQPYPVAAPGTSPHEYGYAFDMVLSPMEALFDAGDVWQSWGGVHGGTRDPVHFGFPGFVPPSTFEPIPEESLRALAVDLGIGFVPVFGTISTVAELVDLFGVSHAEAIKMLASPTHYYNVVRRLLRSYGLA